MTEFKRFQTTREFFPYHILKKPWKRISTVKDVTKVMKMCKQQVLVYGTQKIVSVKMHQCCVHQQCFLRYTFETIDMIQILTGRLRVQQRLLVTPKNWSVWVAMALTVITLIYCINNKLVKLWNKEKKQHFDYNKISKKFVLQWNMAMN